jgi:hypothetical protein
LRFIALSQFDSVRWTDAGDLALEMQPQPMSTRREPDLWGGQEVMVIDRGPRPSGTRHSVDQ